MRQDLTIKTKIKAVLIFLATIFTFYGFAVANEFRQKTPQKNNIISIQDIFAPTGWVGDGELGKKYIDFSGVCKTNPQTPPHCIKVKYTFGPNRWAGIYWQNKADNWGDYPGNDYSLMNIKMLSFWARGETGGEVIEFKAGDIRSKNKKYQDSFASTIGRVTLTKDWKKYIINLENKDLSNVIGGFCWVASADFNTQPNITFYIDDIFLEYPASPLQKNVSGKKTQIKVDSLYAPTGWIGDGELGKKYIDFSGVFKTKPHTSPYCTKVKYTFGPNRWAGIYWQNRADNWGDYAGNDYSLMNIKMLSFWARGETGEETVEFKAGDIKNNSKKYQDSFASTIGRVTLTKDWKKYIINLENKDLSNVIGGFCWVASADFNTQLSIMFYIDDILFE